MKSSAKSLRMLVSLAPRSVGPSSDRPTAYHPRTTNSRFAIVPPVPGRKNNLFAAETKNQWRGEDRTLGEPGV
jgi:hypothetical protein